MWKIEKIVRKGDYNYALVQGHPNSTEYGYVLEHRIIVENHLDRLLNSNEVVHHKNHNKLDNRIENLEIMCVGEHERLHRLRYGRLWADIKCPICSKIVPIPCNQICCKIKRNKLISCSRDCGRKLVRLHRETTKLESAISENIVRVYRKYTLDNTEETIDNWVP